jgi:hypothetical protein
MDVRARTVPTKADEPPEMVAELPTYEKTSSAWAPFKSVIWPLPAVRSVDPAWKMKMGFASLLPFSVRFPVIWMVDAEL